VAQAAISEEDEVVETLDRSSANHDAAVGRWFIKT
jgi:hypothetical protein